MKQASDCYYKLVTKKLSTIFWWYSEVNEHTLSFNRCFLLHSSKFQYFFMDLKVNCEIHMITDMFKNIWKEYFIKECFWSERNILLVRCYRLAVPEVCDHRTPKCDLYKILACDDLTAKQNMACASEIARYSRPGLSSDLFKH